MHTALTMNNEMGGMADERTSAFRRGLVLAGFILVITAGLGAGLYTYGKTVLHERAMEVVLRGGVGASEMNFDLLRRFDMIALSVTAVAVVGGIGSLIPLFVSSGSWRRRVATLLQKRIQDLQGTQIALQSQLTESRRMREGLLSSQTKIEAEAKGLREENARLASELERRNRAEKALTMRRQELEVSKNVLELNVMARTQELQLLQRRYEMILNSAGEGICGFDLQGKTTFVNPTVANLTGWSIAELVGKEETEIFVAAVEPVGAKPVPSARDEQILLRKDGSSCPVEFVKTPIQEEGRDIGWVVVFKDITERKKVEGALSQKASELARSNAELEQFAFVASHDLQEPLRKIQAFGDRLKAKCEGMESSEVRDYLERMQGAAARMRTLINDLLAFSRVIRSSEPFVPVNLEEITREVIGDLEVRIEKRHAQVEMEKLPSVEADPMQMRQLMLNLISNALKFQPAEGTPVVKVAGRLLTSITGEPICEITVQDNGIGFDEKYLEKMFAVFQRLHGRSEYEGTGVGLAVCRRIVDRHHGTITARSKPGQGATFIVTLPAQQNQPQQKAAA